ncbi:MAG: hypothetical protein HY722_01010 [Planctomycetes bacterium]|nr:hypothetical protein [Planctomycetota bacterium]
MTGATLAAAGAFAAGALALRLPYRGMPLENNGAVFLYHAQFRDRGARFDRDVPVTGQPALPFLLALLYPVLGHPGADAGWLRWLSAVASAATTFLTYLLGDALCGPAVGASAAALHALASAAPQLFPWYTNAEWFLGALVSGAMWALCQDDPGTAGALAAGSLLAGAVLFKVVALAFLPAVLLTAAARGGPELAAWTLGGWAVTLAAAEVLARVLGAPSMLAGLPGRLLAYKRADLGVRHLGGGAVRASVGQALAHSLSLGGALALPLVLALGAAVLPGTAPQGPLWAWLAAGLAAVAVQGVWSPGHWSPILAPLALLAGLGFAGLSTRGGPAAAGALTATAALQVLVALGLARRPATSPSAWRAVLGSWSLVARVLAAGTHRADRLFCWAWAPQVYSLADRPSAIPHLNYCNAVYLDQVYPAWRREVVAGLLRTPPARIAVFEPGFPGEAVLRVAGLVYLPLRVHGDLFGGHVFRWAGSSKVALAARGAPDPYVAVRDQALRWAMRDLADGNSAAAALEYEALRAVDPTDPVFQVWAEEFWRLRDPRSERPPLLGHHGVGIVPTRSGDFTADVRRGNRVTRLHGADDPLGEAETMFADGRLAPASAVFLVGLGLGYTLEAARRATPPGTPIVALEAEAALYLHGRRYGPLALAMDDPRVRLIVGRTPAAAAQALSVLLEGDVVMVMHEPSVQLDAGYYRLVFQLLRAAGCTPPARPGVRP